MEESGDFQLVQSLMRFLPDSEMLVLGFRVAKSQASFRVTTTKQRILVLIVKVSQITQKRKVRLKALKETATGFQAEKVYKLGHLSKVEGVPDDKTGCTFILGFDNLNKPSTGAPPQWIMRSVGDRNQLLTSISKLCKEHHGRTPKIVGMDIVEMELWAQKNAKMMTAEVPVLEDHTDVENENPERSEAMTAANEELVSKKEEEDMEALLGTYVLGIDEAEAFSECLTRELRALDDANVHAFLESDPLVDEVVQELDVAMTSLEDMEEWLGIFNVKLRHMREDIESFEAKNNMLDRQAQNNSLLLEELKALTERFQVPPEYVETLMGGPFDEARVTKNVEAGEWLAAALRNLEPPNLDKSYGSMRAVRDKQAELQKLKKSFLGRASTFLENYFSNVVESMIKEYKASISQKGQVKMPDHSDLRFKCRTYARMLQHMKALDKNSLGPLRKSYCLSLNLLLRREAREFASELRGSMKVTQTTAAWLDKQDSGLDQQPPTRSIVSEAYAKMLRIFVPLLVDESSFFASFMCFDVKPLAPQLVGDDDYDEDDISLDVVHTKATQRSPAELEALNQSLQELLDGIQEDFYVIVDWAHRVDPWSCILMQGVTALYLSSTHKADAAEFVRRLLDNLQTRIQGNFNQCVTDANNQFARDNTKSPSGVLSCIHKFANLAGFLEELIGQDSRTLVDSAYETLGPTIFTVIENYAKVETRVNPDVFLLENYAALQDRIYELASVVPALENFYNQATDAYEQACLRFVHTMINYQFERLFMFGQKVENLLLSVEPEQVPSTVGFTKTDLRKTLRASMSGVEKSLHTTYKRMQKSLHRQELLPMLWNTKFKDVFMEKYRSLEELLQKCYREEPLSPSSTEMKAILDSVGVLD